jgi:RHS repeat-associated protein
VTGNINLRRRDYNPPTGRLTAEDPFSGHTRNPLSLHKYLYAHGDPVNGMDPTGLFTLSVSLGRIGIGAFLIGVLGLYAASFPLRYAYETLFVASAAAAAAPWHDAVEEIIRDAGLLAATDAQELTQPLLERIAEAIATATAIATLPCPVGGHVFADPVTGYPRVGVYVVGPNTVRTGPFVYEPGWFIKLNLNAPPADGEKWERGHLIGRQLGGVSNGTNLIPQSFNANRRQRDEAENEIAKVARGGACLVVSALATYGHAAPWERVPTSTTHGYVPLPGFGTPVPPDVFDPILNP